MLTTGMSAPPAVPGAENFCHKTPPRYPWATLLHSSQSQDGTIQVTKSGEAAMDPMLAQRRDEILRVAARHGAGNVRVFGSRARGESRPDSDLDVLITAGERTGLLQIIAIQQDLEDLLNLRVHVVTDDAISPYIRDRVLREAVAL
jgi:uncharacterized protein